MRGSKPGRNARGTKLWMKLSSWRTFWCSKSYSWRVTNLSLLVYGEMASGLETT